jgi:predicted flap endonuclease-1-like 5' DNA nuclease
MLQAFKFAETVRTGWQDGPLKQSLAISEALMRANPFYALWSARKADVFAAPPWAAAGSLALLPANIAKAMVDALVAQKTPSSEAHGLSPANDTITPEPVVHVPEAAPEPVDLKVEAEAPLPPPAPAHTRPPMLDAPERDSADDLTLIKGIGPKVSARLNELGIFHFSQIASWTDSEKAWVEGYLGMPGKVVRGDWAGKAQLLLEA